MSSEKDNGFKNDSRSDARLLLACGRRFCLAAVDGAPRQQLVLKTESQLHNYFKAISQEKENGYLS